MIHPKKITKRLIRSWIPDRKSDSHKGDYGHVLILAGSRGMTGAATLSAWGALRGGAGLVTVGIPESQQEIVAKNVRPEAMTLSLPETSERTFSEDALFNILDFIEKRKVSSLAIGPGISRNSETAQLVRKLLIRLSDKKGNIQGIVLDADGFLAVKSDSGEDILMDLNLPVIVTPHLGEMSKFCGITVETIENDRIQFVQKFAKLYRIICVLKGYKTVVSDGSEIFINSTGNPGMATGGSGDVLTGLIAALVSQMAESKGQSAKSKKEKDFNSMLSAIRYPLLRAACAGVFIHGLAGDLAKKTKTEISLIAGDIAEKFPEALKKVMSDP